MRSEEVIDLIANVVISAVRAGMSSETNTLSTRCLLRLDSQRTPSTSTTQALVDPKGQDQFRPAQTSLQVPLRYSIHLSGNRMLCDVPLVSELPGCPLVPLLELPLRSSDHEKKLSWSHHHLLVSIVPPGEQQSARARGEALTRGSLPYGLSLRLVPK